MRASIKLCAAVLLAMLFIVSACRKPFDEPPIAELPNLEGNMTIAQLIALASPTPVKLDSGKILEAIVTADDKSGNFYKQIIIQDATGGMRIDVDGFDLYNEYPVGRRVWVRLGGLYIYQDGDVPALIGSSDPSLGRIPQALYKEHIIGGDYDNPVVAAPRTLSTLTPADYHTLVTLSDVEFTASYANQTYADVVNLFSTNAELYECNTGGIIIMRNSAYSDFASQLAPGGNGTVTAIFNSFNGTPQLFIRDPSDLDMAGNRCTFLPGANSTLMSIDSVRKLYTGAAVPGPNGRKMRGIVISDKNNGNFQSRNLILQEVNGDGIAIRFTADHSFEMGDEIEVDISGQTISEFNGLLQVAAPNNYATFISSGNSITPRTATVADILANANEWESTLINVQAATLNGGTTYGDFGVMINDATGSMSMFSGFASFGSTPLPTGTGDVTAIIGDFNGTQLNIRNLNDVNISGSGGGGGPNPNLTEMTIAAVRALYSGTNVNAPANRNITGIVISDYQSANITDRNLVMQHSNGSGIVVRFDATHTFALGDSITIDISGQEVSEFNGLLQLNNVPLANASFVSSGNTITPRVTTLADINTNVETWESTLVQVNGITISGGTTYGGLLTLADAGSTVGMFTRNAATFAGDAVATGSVQVTAIVSQFNTDNQLSLRNATNDIQ
jgi:hypothetical protein